MSDGRTAVPLAISLDEESIAELDGTAKARGDSRSSIMRTAIRKGLEFLKAGEGSEPVVLDGELSTDVGKVIAETGLTRGKALLQGIQLGLPAVYSRAIRAKWRKEQEASGEFNPATFEALAHYDSDAHPILMEHARLLGEHRSLLGRLDSLHRNFPEAKRYSERAGRLFELRCLPGGGGGGYPYGLSLEEIEKQIAQHEARLSADAAPAQATAPAPRSQPAKAAAPARRRRKLK